MDEERQKKFATASDAAMSAVDECNTVVSYTPRLLQAMERGDAEAAARYREIIGDEINHALMFLSLYAELLGIEVPTDGFEEV